MGDAFGVAHEPLDVDGEEIDRVGAGLFDQAAARLNGERWNEPTYEITNCGITRPDTRYSHKYTMTANVTVSYWHLPEDMETELDNWAKETEADLLERARALADEIYDSLEKEYEYQQSDQAIIERGLDYNRHGEEREARRPRCAA